MNSDQLKQQVAQAALAHIEAYNFKVDLGVGTGSTVNLLIDLLPQVRHRIGAIVSSSEASTKRLEALEFKVQELNQTGDLTLYIDGADECDAHNRLTKGGGGALTREKIIAAASKKFICIIDHSKQVDILGKFPLPIEVLPMARSYVARQMVKLGGQPIYREGFVTDNGNQIIDIHNLKILDPIELENKINQIPGVVTNGLFAQRKADLVLIANQQGEVTEQ